MNINGQYDIVNIKVSRDKIKLVTDDIEIEMNLEEANVLGQILSEQSNICKQVLNTRGYLNFKEN